MGISLLATLLFLVAFSHENGRHDGKNDGEIEHVNNDKEEAEAWTSDMDMLATIWSLMTYFNTHYGHQDEKIRTLKGSKDLPKKEEDDKVEEEKDKVQTLRGTAEMRKLPQGCKQGKGQLKMYVVPGGQIPRREPTAGRTTALQCCGGEHELFLSHGGNWLWLQSGNRGAGELWCITPTTITGFFAIQCVGAEKGLSLTHLEGQLRLTCSNHGDPNQMWLVEKHHNACTVSFHNGDQRQYLSHAWGWLSCQDGFLGAGELWKPAAGAVVD